MKTKRTVLIPYQIALAGYDGNTDKTDHLVVWVKAPGRKALNRFLDSSKLSQHIQMLGGKPDVYEMTGVAITYEHADGIDFIIDQEGKIVSSGAGASVEDLIRESVAITG